MRTRKGSRGLQLKQGGFVSTATPLSYRYRYLPIITEIWLRNLRPFDNRSIGQIFLWPTVWKENRYKTNATPLGLLISEFILGVFALIFLFVSTPLNGFPIRKDTLRPNEELDDSELYPMTSSSRYIQKYQQKCRSNKCELYG